MNIKGNYELRIATINLSDLPAKQAIEIDVTTEINKFVEVAEELGTVYSAGKFTSGINNEENDIFANSYVRFYLVNKDNTEELIEIDDFNTLYVNEGSIE